MGVLKKTMLDYFNDPARCIGTKGKGRNCLEGINTKMKQKFTIIKDDLNKGKK